MSVLRKLLFSNLSRNLIMLLAAVMSTNAVSLGQAATMLDATKFAGAPDMCLQINNAYLSKDFQGSIDATGFVGLQKCVSNPFHNQNVPVHLYLNPNVTIITSVPWFTPQVTHSIEGLVAGNIGANSANVGGATIEACGIIIPNGLPVTFNTSAGPLHTGTCTYTNNAGVAITQNAFPDTSAWCPRFRVAEGELTWVC